MTTYYYFLIKETGEIVEYHDVDDLEEAFELVKAKFSGYHCCFMFTSNGRG